ncbi:recombination regulator RecX [Clostridium sp.]|uniref:recombination regulator RecX n=1 Tax=Clostridium sp. TaxID=1506 RepID=UPI003EEE8F2A
MSNIITKIEMQKKNKDRVNVYMDGDFAFACDAGLVYRYRITKGEPIDKENIESIVNEDNYIKAKNASLHFLESSFKSAKQVVDKLKLKEFDVKTIGRVMQFLKEYEFIDDKRFVELFIKEKVRSSGKNKIKFTLIKKGLPEELIEEGLDAITSEQQSLIALKLGEKKFAILYKNEKDTRKLYKKIADYLVRNGFDFEIVNEVLNKVIKTGNVNESQDLEVISEDTYEESYRKSYELASKRYRILIKSESEKIKLYKKLGDYLLRRGFKWDVIKKVLRDLINDGYEE